MFFDGEVKVSRSVSDSGKRRDNDKNAVMETSRRQREQRHLEKRRNIGAIRIQSVWRSFQSRIAYMGELRTAFDKQTLKIDSLKAMFVARGAIFNIPLLEIFRLVWSLYYFYDYKCDVHRLVRIGTYISDAIIVKADRLPACNR